MQGMLTQMSMGSPLYCSNTCRALLIPFSLVRSSSSVIRTTKQPVVHCVDCPMRLLMPVHNSMMTRFIVTAGHAMILKFLSGVARGGP